MRKYLGSLFVVCVAILICSLIPVYAASAPKATGDADLTNSEAYSVPANITFNAINTKIGQLDAKGSLIYTDQNITYTMDVQYIKVDSASHTAWFAGQITAPPTITGQSTGCCNVGNWIFYKVQDNGEPGVGQDKVWGEDITQSGRAAAVGAGLGESVGAAALVGGKADPSGPGPQGFLITAGNIQVR